MTLAESANDVYNRWRAVMQKIREQGITLALLSGMFEAMLIAPKTKLPALWWLVASWCSQQLSKRGINWQRLATEGIRT